MDAERVRRAGESPAAEQLLRDAEALASRYAIDSTPSFLVGRTGSSERRVLTGVQDYDTLRPQLEKLAPR